MTKDVVLSSLNELPDNFPLETLIERLIALQKVEKALQEVEEGKFVSEAEARRYLAKWL